MRALDRLNRRVPSVDVAAEWELGIIHGQGSGRRLYPSAAAPESRRLLDLMPHRHADGLARSRGWESSAAALGSADSCWNATASIRAM